MWARDPETSAVECWEIVDPYANPQRPIIELELVDERDASEVLETTDNHPFFVEGRGWTRVDELRLGDQVPSGDGGLLTVQRIYLTGRIETVYNFGVAEFHTYFVGEIGAWVHNCIDPWELIPTQRITKSRKEWTRFKKMIADDGAIKEPIRYVEFKGQKYIVDGHHRARAAKELKFDKVPAEEVALPYNGYHTPFDFFE